MFLIQHGRHWQSERNGRERERAGHKVNRDGGGIVTASYMCYLGTQEAHGTIYPLGSHSVGA